jgi:hypothetical protein
MRKLADWLFLGYPITNDTMYRASHEAVLAYCPDLLDNTREEETTATTHVASRTSYTSLQLMVR